MQALGLRPVPFRAVFGGHPRLAGDRYPAHPDRTAADRAGVRLGVVLVGRTFQAHRTASLCVLWFADWAAGRKPHCQGLGVVFGPGAQVRKCLQGLDVGGHLGWKVGGKASEVDCNLLLRSLLRLALAMELTGQEFLPPRVAVSAPPSLVGLCEHALVIMEWK